MSALVNFQSDSTVVGDGSRAGNWIVAPLLSNAAPYVQAGSPPLSGLAADLQHHLGSCVLRRHLLVLAATAALGAVSLQQVQGSFWLLHCLCSRLMRAPSQLGSMPAGAADDQTCSALSLCRMHSHPSAYQTPWRWFSFANLPLHTAPTKHVQQWEHCSWVQMMINAQQCC